MLVQLIGSPSEAELWFLSDNGRRYVRQLPHYDRQPLSQKFPHINAEAIDLIDKMLLFDPARRITGNAVKEMERKHAQNTPMYLDIFQNTVKFS